MPRRDGTGPMGAGAMTGRGLGPCAASGAVQYGAGLGLACRCGFGRGFGRGIVVNQTTTKTQKELLQEQRDVLQSRIDGIDKQIENL